MPESPGRTLPRRPWAATRLDTRDRHMDSLNLSVIVFAVVFASGLVGLQLRARLPGRLLTAETLEVVKLAMGLIGTMAALVLGLLIASAQSSYETQRNGLSQMAANVIMLDRTLAHYGSDARGARDYMRTSLGDMIEKTWPGDGPGTDHASQPTPTEGRYERLNDLVRELRPATDAQRELKEQALKIGTDTAQARWLLFSQRTSSIPMPLLVAMVVWLALIVGSFGLCAPQNAVAVVTLLACSVVTSSALFLILELDQPLEGLIRIPSDALRNALSQLGR